MRKLIGMLIHRALLLAFTAAACVFLVRRYGPWKAWVVWAAAMLVACGVTALLLGRQKVGTRSVVNRLAGYLLLWGYKVTRGKLPLMLAVSWSIWVLLGAAVISLDAAMLPPSEAPVFSTQLRAAAETGELAQPDWAVALKVVLFLGWYVLGMGIHHLLGVMVQNRRVNPPLVMPTLVLVGLIAVSAAIFLLSPSRGTLITAVLIAAGPTVVIAGGYGLVIGAFIIFGRKGNWR